MRKYLFLFLSFALLFLAVQPVSANHQSQVLGDQASNAAQIPPTSEGPGFLLPDSPLFFLDQIKQDIRLLFALTPEAKAKVHVAIAGERMAELRFMLAKNNQAGIDTALQGISENMQKVADALAQAKLLGKDVSVLAIAINDNIKRKQQALDVLEVSDNREITFKAKATQESLLSTKLAVEDFLSEDRLQVEIADDLNRIVQKEAIDASFSAKRLENALAVLGAKAKANASAVSSKKK